MKQTAVEWLVANIDWQLLRNTKTHYNMIVEQAKTMEKEQMKALYTMCIVDTRTMELYDFEQYYNETFKSE